MQREVGLFGLACISGDAGGAPAAVLHNQTRLLCKSADQACLEQSIIKLPDSPAL